MKKYYRIKAFSKLTSVTVRTLHYYDEISLLKPSHKSSSGHRFYSEKDLLMLQQITTFKFFGFSLKQVKQLLQSPQFDINQSLKMQTEVLANEAIKIQKASDLLNKVVDELNNFNNINWQTIAKMIEVLLMNDKTFETWTKKFLTQGEQNEFESLFTRFTHDQLEDYSKRWTKLFMDVKKNINHEPEGPIGQKLAYQWLALVNEIYGEHPKIRHKLWEAMKLGALPTDRMPYYDQTVITYIDKAIAFYKKVKD